MYSSNVPEALKKVGTVTFNAEYAQTAKADFQFILPVKGMTIAKQLPLEGLKSYTHMTLILINFLASKILQE